MPPSKTYVFTCKKLKYFFLLLGLNILKNQPICFGEQTSLQTDGNYVGE